MSYMYHYNSPLGRITISCTDDSLTGLWFDGQRNFDISDLNDAKDVHNASDLDILKQTIN